VIGLSIADKWLSEMTLTSNYSANGVRQAVSLKIGDCTKIAEDYAKLKYGEQVVQDNMDKLNKVLSEYSNSYTGVLSREDFFESVKPELDELLSE